MAAEAVPQQHGDGLGEMPSRQLQQLGQEFLDQLAVAVIEAPARPRQTLALPRPVGYQHVVTGRHQALGQARILARRDAQGRQDHQRSARFGVRRIKRDRTMELATGEL